MFSQSKRAGCLFKAPAIAENREGSNPNKFIVDSVTMQLQKAECIPPLKSMISIQTTTTPINAPKTTSKSFPQLNGSIFSF